jgi:ribosomal protein S18 acetylase RimI-like enzyme
MQMPLTEFKLLNYGVMSSATKLHTTNPTWPFQKKSPSTMVCFLLQLKTKLSLARSWRATTGIVDGCIFSVGVDPGTRLHGLGSALVHHAENALAELGCMKVNLQLLETNEATAAFYKSIGYAVEPRVSMGKLL